MSSPAVLSPPAAIDASQGVGDLNGREGMAAKTTRTAVPPVAGVVNFCGVTDFLTFPGRGNAIDAEGLNSPIGRLFGGLMSRHLEAAKAASPVTYITVDAPSFYIHGTKDTLVPYSQAKAIHQAAGNGRGGDYALAGYGGSHALMSQELFRKLR